MGAAYHAQAGGDGAGEHCVDIQEFEGDARAHDVDDGVDAADLVKVDGRRIAAVHAALDLGEDGESGQRPITDAVRKSGLLDQALDVGVGAHDRRLVGGDVNLGAGDAAALHGLGVDVPPTQRETHEVAHDLVEVGAGVDERTEGHVAGDPGEAVEPGGRAHRLGLIRPDRARA